MRLSKNSLDTCVFSYYPFPYLCPILSLNYVIVVVVHAARRCAAPAGTADRAATELLSPASRPIDPSICGARLPDRQAALAGASHSLHAKR